ncbi:MAG: prepilin-type N-terminal cleavage/methylation domain-containing protein [Planctomycetes bacterium]|nr:prepilin-type N-terminal cleavage/methylation domain-containing protein [Planctomycetota bacterium]
MGRSRGFSLIELVLVVSVIALALTFALPNLVGRTPRYALRAAGREVGATIQLARSQAVLDGESYGVRYDVSEGTFRVLLPEGLSQKGSDAGLSLRRLDPEVRLESIVTPDGKGHDGGEVDIELTPTGTAGSHIVILSNTNDERLYVKFHALVGTLTFSSDPLSWHEYKD